MKIKKKHIQLFIIAGLLLFGGLVVWLWQRNTFSKELLKFEVIAPSEATLGEEITYIVRWKNNSQVRLENAVLFFEYPEGSAVEGSSNLRVTRRLDDIYPGQEETLQFKGRLFGKEGELKEAKATLAYNPKNLHARFEGQTKGTTLIAFVPLSFELDMPSRTESEQQLNFALNYFSNSEYPLADLRIKIEYPDGFGFAQATPQPIGENEWKIGVLNKTQGGRIGVRGKLQGELQEVKIFRASLGSWREGKFTLLKEIARGVEITKPQLQISQLINGDTPSFVQPGDILHYEIFFKNVSERNLENLFLVVALEGIAFDAQTIQTQEGSFQQGDNSIVWEAKNVPRLRFLGKGETGRAEFWVRARDAIEGFDPKDKNLVLRSKILLSDAKEDFEVKVSSRLAAEQRAFYQDEAFGNSGPLPPRAGESTTYTIIWQAKNSFNDVKNAKVKAILPQGVELTGKTFPEGAPLTFDSQSREIVWAAGDLLAGTGTFSNIASVAFQIRFSPSAFQRGSAAQLVGHALITGDDAWTIQTISGIDLPVTTTELNDPSFSQAQGIVQ
ncbi:MAG: hypothetical protein HYS52_00805 [Candidatus Wildermuthbacteria bacterium]|nr:hypothetical protein [Candidatus Wildermuthbacteria bacterium]